MKKCHFITDNRKNKKKEQPLAIGVQLYFDYATNHPEGAETKTIMENCFYTKKNRNEHVWFQK